MYFRLWSELYSWVITLGFEFFIFIYVICTALVCFVEYHPLCCYLHVFIIHYVVTMCMNSHSLTSLYVIACIMHTIIQQMFSSRKCMQWFSFERQFSAFSFTIPYIYSLDTPFPCLCNYELVAAFLSIILFSWSVLHVLIKYKWLPELQMSGYIRMQVNVRPRINVLANVHDHPTEDC